MSEALQHFFTPQQMVELVYQLTEPLVSSEPYSLDTVVKLDQ